MESQGVIKNEMLKEFINASQKQEEKNDSEEELEIKRKYYEKPDMESLEAADFLSGFIQGMGQ
jgi:hypothetical protein